MLFIYECSNRNLGHNKQTCQLFLHTIFYDENQVESCEYRLFGVFGVARLGIELRVLPLD